MELVCETKNLKIHTKSVNGFGPCKLVIKNKMGYAFEEYDYYARELHSFEVDDYENDIFSYKTSSTFGNIFNTDIVRKYVRINGLLSLLMMCESPITYKHYTIKINPMYRGSLRSMTKFKKICNKMDIDYKTLPRYTKSTTDDIFRIIDRKYFMSDEYMENCMKNLDRVMKVAHWY